MTNAKTLICLDAHLSKASVQMIQRFCPDKPVTIHFNRFEPGCARQIAFHDSPESVQMAALQALEQEQKVYLAFNSKKEAFKTYSALSMAFPEKKVFIFPVTMPGMLKTRLFLIMSILCQNATIT